MANRAHTELTISITVLWNPYICTDNCKPLQSVPRVSILRPTTTDSRDIYTFVLFPHFYDQTARINNTAHCDDHSKPHKIPAITRGAMLSPTFIHWQICNGINHTQSFNISFIWVDLKAIPRLETILSFHARFDGQNGVACFRWALCSWFTPDILLHMYDITIDYLHRGIYNPIT